VVIFKEVEHKIENYKSKLHNQCDEQCFYNCSQGGTVNPSCIKEVENESNIIQDIKKCLYESAKKIETENGFDIVIQFEEQAKELLKQFTITRK